MLRSDVAEDMPDFAAAVGDDDDDDDGPLNWLLGAAMPPAGNQRKKFSPRCVATQLYHEHMARGASARTGCYTSFLNVAAF
eukprot:1637644-Alexandrium_andersonii.AAC.1